MPRITTVQAAHTYGVLDPHVIERRDTKFIGGSLSDGENIILLPQGGYTDRGGTTDYGRARFKLTSIAINTTILSLPNGGSEADLLAGTAITTATVSTTRFVLFQCDFAGPTKVHMIDIKGVSIATTPADNALIAEYWDGANWIGFAAPLKITLDGYSRRFASGAPGHAGITATKFRVAVDATTAAGAVTFSGIALWAEGNTLSDGVVRRYAPEQGMAHQLIYTENNIDVFEGGIWRASIAAPIGETLLRIVKPEPKFDTIGLWAQELRPQQVSRLGSSTEWACDPIVFENLPLVDYGGVYTNGVNEVQEVALYDFNIGEKFDLIVEGQTTEAIEYAGDNTTTQDNIKNAIEALSNVEPGLIITRTGAANFTVTVEFAGDGNENRDWLQMSGNALNVGGFVRTRTVTQGKEAGEDIISNARGWPAVGRYAQQRLITAGLKSRPNDVLASVTGDPFNFNTKLTTAIAAFSYEVSSDNASIRDMLVSRTLLFFGDQQLAYLKNKVLSAEEVPEFGTSDAPGIKATTSPVTSDNAVFIVQEGGKSLRLVNYTELEQNYVSDNASVLSAHLIRDPVDIFRRRASGAVDSDLICMVNADGTMTALTIMRTQEVSGFAPWRTDGEFVSGCADHDNQVWLLVKRHIYDHDEIRLELQEPSKLLDEGIEATYGDPVTMIDGLERFKSRDVWVIANDSLYGPFNVAENFIELPEPTSQTRIGSWVAPFATDPEVSLTEETRARMARLKRVNRAEISVLNTTSLAIRANDGDVVDVPLRTNADTILDEGPLTRKFTGKAEAEGMHGFTDHGKLTVTQLYPGYLTVRSVTKNVVA